MKIGEAGEAFFVFETDDDVPEDLITSPILQPTRPEEGTDIPTDRFGARQDPDEPENRVHPDDATETPAPEQTTVEEPEFLDLNAEPTPQLTTRPSHRKRPSTLSISSTGPDSPTDSPSQPSATPASMLSMEETQDERVDRALKVVQESMAVNEVQYKHGKFTFNFKLLLVLIHF
jgi:phosphatidate phosphatase LPIN